MGALDVGGNMTRIVHVSPNQASPNASVLCCACGKWGATLADLDGEPFKAFYHAECLPTEEKEEA